MMEFVVQTLFDGDIIFDAHLSTFDVVRIEGYTYLDDKVLASDTDTDGILTLYDYPAGNYRFLLGADPGTFKTFVVMISCESDKPTMAPTDLPTQSPTSHPVESPTDAATLSPGNFEPSIKAETLEPTQQPTMEPTTTPWNECDDDGVECELIAQINIILSWSASNGLGVLIQSILYESMQIVLTVNIPNDNQLITVSMNDASTNANIESGASITAMIATNDQAKMDKIFDDIEETNVFLNDLWQTIDELMDRNLQQNGTFELNEVAANITLLKPSMDITPTDGNLIDATEETIVETGTDLPISTIIACIIIVLCLICCCVICIGLRRRRTKGKEEHRRNSKMVEMNVSQQDALKDRDADEFAVDKALVAAWLHEMGLEMYYKLFVVNGYDSMKAIKAIESKQELIDIGVVIPGHRTAMMAGIRKLHQEGVTKGYTEDNDAYNMQQIYLQKKYSQYDARTSNLPQPAVVNGQYKEEGLMEYATSNGGGKRDSFENVTAGFIFGSPPNGGNVDELFGPGSQSQSLLKNGQFDSGNV